MTTMLEMAAMAAHEEQRGAGFDFFDQCGFLEQEKWRDIARAVLMSVREPAESVLSAKTPLGPMHRYGQWQAMIDAILNEGAAHGQA